MKTLASFRQKEIRYMEKKTRGLIERVLVLALLAAFGRAVSVSALAGEPSVAAQGATLVAWYAFEGNADDSSGNDYHGILNGAPALTTGK